ncbi:MAG: acetyltransferase [Thermoleophilia bacterium]|nr:acetyltransferase [Thermoleophilia bacterium]
MTNIEYTDRLDGVSAEHLAGGFFEGWPDPPTPDRHLDLLRGSHRVVLAREAGTGTVVGFVNATGDGVLTAYIPLLEVLPAWRGRGIATELVRRMLDGLRVYMVDLACDDDLVQFYERLGLHRTNAMIQRRYELQSGART